MTRVSFRLAQRSMRPKQKEKQLPTGQPPGAQIGRLLPGNIFEKELPLQRVKLTESYRLTLACFGSADHLLPEFRERPRAGTLIRDELVLYIHEG